MPSTYSDKYQLAADLLFQGRVRQAMLAYCGTVNAENANTVPYHGERAAYAVACMNGPMQYGPLFAYAVANDQNVIDDATQGGTVPLTQTNVDSQSLLITDAHIDAAVASQYNSFFKTPGS